MAILKGVKSPITLRSLQTLKMLFSWSRTFWRDRVDAGHLDAKNVPFAAALVKLTNNPIWLSFIFFNDACC